ncbi:winged helix-turn-helix transcriptional regulator [Nocardia cyriacigeorgica]|uniref:winged helix-turn-helix transcriptional regulator n=1 Tax=Nocardia cyriacigeorgica TaxID=135487 RepID=UPI00245396FD|nr:helix-turn-helix domain-containing protein [Nocardia cyriacigeorgica]
MEWLEFSTANCSVQRTLDVIGDRWTMIVLRELFNGVHRFEQIRQHSGISESVLSNRLGKLVEAGVLDAVPYRESGSRTRREYRLTAKGMDLYPILLALLRWGDEYCADPEGPALKVEHRDCGHPVDVVVRCHAGHELEGPRRARARPGPAAKAVAETPPRT